ncbi:hypothetical protein GTV15_07140 [Streptomyces sp. SID7803]|nr:hypothetical protein [Streptomyces sp. SID7803]
MSAVHGLPNLNDVLRANLIQLRHWHAGLTAKQQRNIEIRAYPPVIPPTASVILFDVKRHSGFAHVEPVLHTIAPPWNGPPSGSPSGTTSNSSICWSTATRRSGGSRSP